MYFVPQKFMGEANYQKNNVQSSLKGMKNNFISAMNAQKIDVKNLHFKPILLNNSSGSNPFHH